MAALAFCRQLFLNLTLTLCPLRRLALTFRLFLTLALFFLATTFGFLTLTLSFFLTALLSGSLFTLTTFGGFLRAALFCRSLFTNSARFSFGLFTLTLSTLGGFTLLLFFTLPALLGFTRAALPLCHALLFGTLLSFTLVANALRRLLDLRLIYCSRLYNLNIRLQHRLWAAFTR